MTKGTCKVWRGEFGFILTDDGRDNVFLHHRECERCQIQTPKAGDRLEFEIEPGPKGLRAVRVRFAIAT
jgi:cold shock protein